MSNKKSSEKEPSKNKKKSTKKTASTKKKGNSNSKESSKESSKENKRETSTEKISTLTTAKRNEAQMKIKPQPSGLLEELQRDSIVTNFQLEDTLLKSTTQTQRQDLEESIMEEKFYSPEIASRKERTNINYATTDDSNLKYSTGSNLKDGYVANNPNSSASNSSYDAGRNYQAHESDFDHGPLHTYDAKLQREHGISSLGGDAGLESRDNRLGRAFYDKNIKK